MRTILSAALLLMLAGCQTSSRPAAPIDNSPEPRIHTYREVDGRALSAYVFVPARHGGRERTSAAGGFFNSLLGGRVTLPVGHSPNEPYERLDLAVQHACALANAMKQSRHIRQAQGGDRPVVREKQ